jgi:hypothetical protein
MSTVLARLFFPSLLITAPLASQPVAGTYMASNVQGSAVKLVLQESAGSVTGTLSGNGNVFQLRGAANGDMIEGTVTGNGMNMLFGARVQGDDLLLILAEAGANGQPNLNSATQLTFRRDASAPAEAPVASAAPPSPAGGGSAGGKSAEDQRMIQVLTANGWCSFSFSGSSGSYSSGGVSRTSRTMLYPDGTVVSSSNTERSSSGAAGSAAVATQGGDRGFWKFENGVLYIGLTPQSLQPQQFRMTYNSNGSPIPVVNGTEYMICR